MTADFLPIERTARDDLKVFERPAELVDMSERLYQQIFALGLWVAAGCVVFALSAGWLQNTAAGSEGLLIGGACLVGMVAAAIHPATIYRALRRHPALIAVPATVLGACAWILGPHNQFFVPIAGIVGVLGMATPLRVVVASGLIAATGLCAAQTIGGRANIGGSATALAVIVPPVMFWLMMERIAGFALRLNLVQAAATPLDGRPPDSGGHASRVHDGSPANQDRTDGERQGLPLPRSIVVEGTRLTSRQLQVLLLACEGLRHAEIGACLGIGPQQVRRHLLELRQRTGSVSGPQLVAWACRAGLIPRKESGAERRADAGI